MNPCQLHLIGPHGNPLEYEPAAHNLMCPSSNYISMVQSKFRRLSCSMLHGVMRVLKASRDH